jgi:uncharacterized protein (DUF2147 family)
LLGAILAAWLVTGPAWSQAATGSIQPDPTGEWLVAKKLARIKIADCGGQMWGVVQWEAQAGGIDRNNPDPNLRSRPTLGMPILLGMKQSKPNQWDGEIYNSEDGHTYSANIALLNPNTLRVQGCFLGFLCGGENWTRFEDNPDTAQARAAPPATNNRRPAANIPPETSDDVCLRLFGPTRLPHQGRLK